MVLLPEFVGAPRFFLLIFGGIERIIFSSIDCQIILKSSSWPKIGINTLRPKRVQWNEKL